MKQLDILPIIFCFLLLQGCSLLGYGPPSTYSLMPQSTYEDLACLPVIPYQLLVDRPSASFAIDNNRIALLKTPVQIDYFADTQWGDRLSSMVQTLLIESFENSCKLPAVGRYGGNLRGQYVLLTTIRDFQADYSEGKPPSVHVHLVTKLIRMPDRQIIDIYSSQATIQATEDRMGCIIAAFNQATGCVLKDIVTHTLQTLAKLPQPRR